MRVGAQHMPQPGRQPRPGVMVVLMAMVVVLTMVVAGVVIVSARLGARVAHTSQLGGGSLLQHLDHSAQQAPAIQSRWPAAKKPGCHAQPRPAPPPADSEITVLMVTGRVLLVDGIHDLGGMQGLGPVVHSPAEPAFRHRWQAVARALLLVVAGAVDASGGEFRHSIERMEAGHYLTSGYYEHWLTAAATLAVEHGLVTRSDLEARAGGRFPLGGPVLAAPVAEAGPDVGEPRFGVGDRVRVRDWHPPGHTRCPGYVRGKTGAVVRVDGIHSVPDIEAHSAARRYEPAYSVRFDAADLWRDGQYGVSVHVDLWDSYLERS